MKFLCLHGNGTNANIMKLQTAPLRHELQDEHTYEFVEAATEVPFSKGLETWASTDDGFWNYYNEDDFSALPQTLTQLDHYVATQGPFDAIMGFSAGAVLAGLYMLQKQRRGEGIPFRCAIFLSGGSSGPALEFLGIKDPGDLIRIPTAHIWGSADDVAPTGGEDLSMLCDPSKRLTLIHDGGHEVPRKGSVTESVHLIRRIVALGLEA